VTNTTFVILEEDLIIEDSATKPLDVSRIEEPTSQDVDVAKVS